MKKVILGILLAVIVLLAGCSNKAMRDNVWHFDRAILKLPDGTIVEGKVQSWMDFEDSDQLQVKINGKTYLIHSENCVLIAD